MTHNGVGRTAALAVILLAAASAEAQQKVTVESAVVHEATKGSGGTEIEVTFSRSYGTDAAVEKARKPEHYRLVDLFAKDPKGNMVSREIPVTPTVEPLDLGLPERELPVTMMTTVDLEAKETLVGSADGRYVLLISGLTFGKDSAPLAVAPVGVSFVDRSGDPAVRVSVQLAKAKDREAADLFFSGELARSANDDFFGTLDVKVRYPFLQPVWRRRIHVFSPTFDLKASSNPEADPDNAKAGLTWTWLPVVKPQGAWPTTQWDNVVGFEASKDFDRRNFVWQSLATLMPRTVAVDRGMAWLDPQFGFEFGRTLATETGEGEGIGILRGVLGVSATLDVPGVVGKRLLVNAAWQMRQLFKEELLESGTLEKGDHHWRTLRAELHFTDYLSFSAVFEHGRPAPKFKWVDKSLKLGLIYKAALKPQLAR